MNKRFIKNVISIVLILLMCGAVFLTMNSAKNHAGSDANQENHLDISDGQPPEKPGGEASEGENGQPPEMPAEKREIGNADLQTEQNLQAKYYVFFGIESFILAAGILYLFMSCFHKKTVKETFFKSDKIVIYILALILLTGIFTGLSRKITTECFLNKEQTIPMQDQQTNTSIIYTGVKEITENTVLDGGEFESVTKDENTILVSGNVVAELENIVVNKTGDSEGEDSSFYGNNSGILAKDGAELELKNITVVTDASGANGVFSYGGSASTNNSSSDGTTVTISDSEITTTKDNAGGIMTTGGGTMKAENLTVHTSGISSAAIRTDRGGGTVNVNGGTYTTTGAGSPAIYSTANVEVSNAALIAEAAEGIVIEGKNSVAVDHCELEDNNTKLNGQSTTYKNIFLYQSMSGDAAEGNAEFSAKDSTITTKAGDTLYVTNTTANIYLENNTIVNHDTSGNFLRIQKDSWGNNGSNGGNVTLLMKNQAADGNIVVDSISTLDMTLESDSYYEGAINTDQTAKSVNLTLDQTSNIRLTGDSYVTAFDNADPTNSNIDFNGYQLYVNGKAIN